MKGAILNNIKNLRMKMEWRYNYLYSYLLCTALYLHLSPRNTNFKYFVETNPEYFFILRYK